MRKLLFLFVILFSAAIISCNNSGTGTQTTSYNVSINVTPSDAGSISPSADGTYDEGEEIELQANSNEGYVFSGWTGDMESTDNPHSLTVDSDYSITANFKLKSYSLTVNTEGEGTVSEQIVQQKADYEHGTVVELTADPAEGYTFVEWMGDLTGVENPAQITIDDSKEVTAVFEKESYSITVNTTGQGSVARTPDQQEYEYGTNVDLNATPATGWDFEKWEGDITSTANSVQLTVDGAKDVTAVFVEQSQALFYLAENGVTIKCENAQVGDSGTVNGVTYTKRNKSQITPTNAETTCTSGIMDMSYSFSGASSFNGDISSWDVSNVTDMRGMFFRANSFNTDISYWNVESVTDMSYTFLEALAFNQDMSSWDVSSVTDMENMFDGASSFNQNLNSWNVGNVNSMLHMFRDASSFNGDISSWDVGSVTDMKGMFARAISFNQDINNWNVSNVIYMDYMFASAESFNQSLNSWNVSNVLTMDGMFQSATSFNGDISSWNVVSVEPMDHMFEEAESFNKDIGNWDVSSVINMEHMFYKAGSFNQDLSGWCVSNIDSYPSSFAAVSPLDSNYYPIWGTCP